MPARPLLAAAYDIVTAPLERGVMRERRTRLLSQATGRVLEVGAGTGANLGLYRGVDQLVMLEPDAAMRRRLLGRVPSAAVPVEVHEMTLDEAGAEPESFAPGSFDTAVCTLVLCTVPDLDTALGTLRGLLKPGGRLLFLEHVRSGGLGGRVQAAVDPVWNKLAAGCHLTRDPVSAMRGAGLVVAELDRFTTARAGPAATWVQGVAFEPAVEDAA